LGGQAAPAPTAPGLAEAFFSIISIGCLFHKAIDCRIRDHAMVPRRSAWTIMRDPEPRTRKPTLS
jgi:hypothetical protein